MRHLVPRKRISSGNILEGTLNKGMQIHSTCQKYLIKKISIDQACRNDVWYDGMHVITMATNLLHVIEAK